MERYESWIERAKSSYEISKIDIKNNIYYEDLCYQSQQAVEKAFKGLLIYYGIDPEFTQAGSIFLFSLFCSVSGCVSVRLELLTRSYFVTCYLLIVNCSPPTRLFALCCYQLRWQFFFRFYKARRIACC